MAPREVLTAASAHAATAPCVSSSRRDPGGTESGTDALTRRLTLRPEAVVWLDHVQVNLSRGRRHDLREDLCAAAGSGIARTSLLTLTLTLTRSHSHGWPL